MRTVHVFAASVLGWGTLLHVLAVVKHIVIDRDGAFDRMMEPGEPIQQTTPPP